MKLADIIGELRDELDALNVSILAFERIEQSKGPRLGRPPRWIATAKGAASSKPRKASRSVKNSAH